MSNSGHSFHESATWVADTGIFIACGRQQSTKYTAFARFTQQNELTLVIPRRVYEELGGAPERSTLEQTPINSAINAIWVTAVDLLNNTNSTIATVIDDVRSYIAHASNHPEEHIEKADTALAGVAVEATSFPDQTNVVDWFDLITDLTA